MNDIDKLKEDIKSENNNINYLFGCIMLLLAFIMVLYSITSSNKSIGINDLIIVSLLIIINLIGYALILLPMIAERSNYFFLKQNILISWLIPPVILLLSILLISSMSELNTTNNSTDFFVLFKYLLYVLLPITVVSLTRLKSLKPIIEKPLIDLIIFLFLLFWVWWGIEFNNDLNLFPDLVHGMGYLLNLLAFLVLTWSFFVIQDVEINRSFSRLFTKSNLKVVGTWLVILLLIIVPIGLVISFLAINPDNLVKKGPLGALGYLILAVVGVFLVQGIGEEMLFRGFFYFILKKKLENLSEEMRGYVLVCLFFLVAGLICLTPYIGLADPINDGIVNSTVIPLTTIYPIIGIFYFTIGILVMYKTKDLTLTMVVWSSMLFGWAHFEDWRYLIFATIAGFGYCETYRRTNNLFAGSTLHMLVDVTWGAVLSV